MSDDTERIRGHRLVLSLYAVVVAIAGVTGFVIGVVRPRDLDPELFGVVQLPPTPAGMAVYGAVTLAVGLGAVLGLVVYVSNRYAGDADRPDHGAGR